MAGYFGTTVWMSAFVVAFTIPNLFRRLFGEGALSAALVPVMIEVRARNGDRAAWSLALRVFVLAAAVLVGAVIVGRATISLWLGLASATGRLVLILELLRIMLPYAVFICLGALFMAALNAYGVFGIPAAMPCVLNVVWIAALLLVSRCGDPDCGIRLVAYAVVIAGVLQAGLQVPAMWRRGLRLVGRGVAVGPAWRVVKLALPAALGLAITQVNVVVDRVLASWISSWAPAALYYSERLIYLPLGVIATALGTVLLPAYSDHVARRDDAGAVRTMLDGTRHMLFLMIPAAAGLCLLARPVIEMIFQWRVFTEESAWLTARALRFYAPGLVVFALNKALVPAFYSRQDTRTPFRLGAVTVGLNIVLNVIFVLTLPLYYKHAGIALGTVLAESVYCFLLARRLQGLIRGVRWNEVLAAAARIAAAAAVMIVVVWLAGGPLASMVRALALGAKQRQVIYTLGLVLTGMATYLVACVLFGVSELRTFYRAYAARRR